MDVNTIIKLLDAGYTREEISALDTAGDGPAVTAPALTEETNVLKASESSGPSGFDTFTVAPEQPAATSTGLDDLKAIVDGLADQLKTLTKTVQANNIINSEQPAKPVQTAADILASIINPYTSKGEQ